MTKISTNWPVLFDNVTADTTEAVIALVAPKLFNKTSVGKWFNEKGLINKQNPADKLTS